MITCFQPSKLKQVTSLLTVLFLTTPSLAQSEDDWPDDDWQQEQISPWQYSGFFEAAIGHFTQSAKVDNHRSLAELRGQFKLDFSHDNFDIISKSEVIYDDVLASTNLNFRELYLSSSPTDFLDIKVGKQVLTWGTGDYLFLNDLFAKDWQSFFSGREDPYLKAPSKSIKTSWYFNDINLDLVWTPKFQADNFLTGERFSYYSPIMQQQISASSLNSVKQSKQDQWSLRLSTTVNSIELALYGYHGVWTTPQGINENQQPYFPALNAIGASLRMPLGEGLFNTEVAFYHSADDKLGNNDDIINSQSRWLIAYEQELYKNLTASMQYYVERSKNFDKINDYFFGNSDQYRHLVTLRLNYLAMQQKLTLSLFGFYSPSDKDSYIRPSINYRHSDKWSYTVGGNLFFGSTEQSFFGQHQDNSNIWARVRFQF